MAEWANLFGQLCGAGMVIWLIKREIGKNTDLTKKIVERMECFEKAQAACQIANTKEFATKEDIKHLWQRVDDNTSDIATIKGVMSQTK